MQKARVGFIGLGAMGAGMAANLIRAGFPVTVHNRTREREEPLAELGAERAAVSYTHLTLPTIYSV